MADTIRGLRQDIEYLKNSNSWTTHAPVSSPVHFQGTKGSDQTERSEILPLNLKGTERKDAQKEQPKSILKLPQLNESKNQADKPQLSKDLPKTSSTREVYREPSIMFTRTDAERNIKSLDRAVNRGYLTDQEYQVSLNILVA